MSLTQTVEWVPVEQELPPEDGWYSVAFELHNAVGSAYYSTFDRAWTDGESFPLQPTHWARPLKHPTELKTR